MLTHINPLILSDFPQSWMDELVWCRNHLAMSLLLLSLVSFLQIVAHIKELCVLPSFLRVLSLLERHSVQAVLGLSHELLHLLASGLRLGDGSPRRLLLLLPSSLIGQVAGLEHVQYTKVISPIFSLSSRSYKSVSLLIHHCCLCLCVIVTGYAKMVSHMTWRWRRPFVQLSTYVFL